MDRVPLRQYGNTAVRQWFIIHYLSPVTRYSVTPLLRHFITSSLSSGRLELGLRSSLFSVTRYSSPRHSITPSLRHPVIFFRAIGG
jgi:hypothetical protein